MNRSFKPVISGMGDLDYTTGIHRSARKLMGSMFEIYVLHEDIQYAEQAAWQAFEEIQQLEQEISRFIENSDISRLNNLSPGRSIRIGPDTFECLKMCSTLYEETGGAFDITAGSQSPPPAGFCLELNERDHSVRVLSPQVSIDLGGFGKGYAVDRMADILRDWDMERALIHAGFSSVLALGAPPGRSGWPITTSHPDNREEVLAQLELKDRAISGSGLEKGQHIIDSQRARPAQGRTAAWASASIAATSDALSTAFMVMSLEDVKDFCVRHEDVFSMIVLEDNPDTVEERVLRFGSWSDHSISQ
ncbi:MAG: FAD:protein FMN transferase [Candidatus Neomarinimicrobiota bacterium]